MMPVLCSIAILVALLATRCAEAYGIYQDRIPNGYNVKDPGDPTRSWPAVGHMTRNGGAYNPFGDDFDAEGRRWTFELCMMDSDGDGASNGVELGDPSCEWKPGRVPKYTTNITHPGIKTTSNLGKTIPGRLRVALS